MDRDQDGIQGFERLNPQPGLQCDPDGGIRIRASCGSMWQRGKTCDNLLLGPAVDGDAGIGVDLDFRPQNDGEQAGLVLFRDWDHYIKLVREQVGGEQVVVIARKLDGQAEAVRIEGFTPHRLRLELAREGDRLRFCWQAPDLPPQVLVEPDWGAWPSVRWGLLVHGRNEQNEARFTQINRS